MALRRLTITRPASSSATRMRLSPTLRCWEQIWSHGWPPAYCPVVSVMARAG